MWVCVVFIPHFRRGINGRVPGWLSSCRGLAVWCSPPPRGERVMASACPRLVGFVVPSFPNDLVRVLMTLVN
ncbi:hypothetical protein E2C01_048677 [Portunus trituberculatus]|uniref:Uncharacterized protein n=1 Tax=Portunus trituberculatus TaxID=210409 RepID=A0A5B7G732_PORTR|nr:hypothetical protein [Portunus trituberculatus]